MPRTALAGIPNSSNRREPSSSSFSEQPRKKARPENPTISSMLQEHVSAHAKKAPPAAPHTSTEHDLLSNIMAMIQRGGQGVAPSSWSAVGGGGDEALAAAQKEAQFWKSQFEAMQEARVTEPEQRLGELRKALSARNQQVDALVAVLKNRGALEKASSDAAAPAAPPAAKHAAPEEEDEVESDLAEVVDSLEAKLDEKRELLRAYQRLTGVALTVAEEEEDGETLTVQCTAINHIHKRVAKFDLLLPRAAGKASAPDATFIPTANRQLMPADMQAALRFDSQQLPILTQRLRKQLYTK